MKKIAMLGLLLMGCGQDNHIFVSTTENVTETNAVEIESLSLSSPGNCNPPAAGFWDMPLLSQYCLTTSGGGVTTNVHPKAGDTCLTSTTLFSVTITGSSRTVHSFWLSKTGTGSSATEMVETDTLLTIGRASGCPYVKVIQY